jgi:DNA-directed RNA polymerase specialized sigma24 family protein
LSGQQQASIPTVQSRDKRALFDEVFLPYMADAYRLAHWLTGNSYDAEDVVQDAALRAFRGIKGVGAVNARARSITIVRNTACSWLMNNRPKAVVFIDDLRRRSFSPSAPSRRAGGLEQPRQPGPAAPREGPREDSDAGATIVGRAVSVEKEP